MTVTITYATPANGTREFTVDGADPGSVDARRDWAYLPRSALPTALEEGPDDPATGVVTVGVWVLVGDLTAASTPVRNSRVTVVAPAGMDVDPARKAGFLAEFVSPYRLHPSPPASVTFVVASEEAKMLVMTHSPLFEDWFVELGEPVDEYELPAPGSEEENQAKAAAITPELCERFNIEITGLPPV